MLKQSILALSFGITLTLAPGCGSTDNTSSSNAVVPVATPTLQSAIDGYNSVALDHSRTYTRDQKVAACDNLISVAEPLIKPYDHRDRDGHRDRENKEVQDTDGKVYKVSTVRNLIESARATKEKLLKQRREISHETTQQSEH